MLDMPRMISNATLLHNTVYLKRDCVIKSNRITTNKYRTRLFTQVPAGYVPNDLARASQAFLGTYVLGTILDGVMLERDLVPVSP